MRNEFKNYLIIQEEMRSSFFNKNTKEDLKQQIKVLMIIFRESFG